MPPKSKVKRKRSAVTKKTSNVAAIASLATYGGLATVLLGVGVVAKLRSEHKIPATLLKDIVSTGGGESTLLKAGKIQETMVMRRRLNDDGIFIMPTKRHSPTRGDDNVMRVLLYNIQQRPIPSEGLRHQIGLGHNERSLLSTVYLPTIVIGAFQDTDVVVICEAFTPSLRVELRKQFASLGFAYSTQVLGATTARAWTGGVIIFSKHVIEEASEHIFAASASSDKNAAKGVLYAQIRKGTTPYHIFATHLNASYGFHETTGVDKHDAGHKARMKQLEEMGDVIGAKRIQSGEAVIIAGDFNIDYHTERRKTDSAYAKMLEKLWANDGNNKNPGYSFDSQNNTLAKKTEGRQLLDYILYSHLEPKELQYVLGDNIKYRHMVNNQVLEEKDLSDHYSLYAKFTY